MNAKNTWIWLGLAGALFAFIYFFERHWGQPPPGPPPLLPGLKADAVTRIIIFSETLPDREIRVELTNANWWMTQPVNYPAQKSRIVELLAVLGQLVPATAITPGELHRRPGMEAEFGLENPPTSLVLHQDGVVTTLKFGRRTAPGDQVFAQIVGREGIYVLDAEVLKLLPASADDWRDRALVDFQGLRFDTINITNVGRPVIKLQFEATNQVWRVRQPLSARADGAYLETVLKALQSTSVGSFVPAEGRADLDTLGLQPPLLSVAFAQGNVNAVLLQFGRTNAAGQCYARRDGLDSIVTIPAEALAAWLQDFYGFRDYQLIAVPPGLTAVESRGSENFTLERVGTNQWRIPGEKFPVDAERAQEFLDGLGGLQIDFVKDVVSTQEFGLYGLTSAVHQVVFKTAAPGSDTNGGHLRLEFGSTATNNNGEVVYVRRSDEASIYAVRAVALRNLPTAGWQLRDRRIGSFAPSEITRLLARKGSWTRELVRSGTNSWAFGPASQGVLDNVCLAELVPHLEQLRATLWVARGAAAADDARFGFGTNSLTLALEMKTGDKLELQFGGYSSAKYPYARVTLDGEPWVFEFPSALHSFLLSCLSVPSGAP